MANETYTLIQKTTLNASAASITFSSIPQTFTDLVVMLTPRASIAADRAELYLTVNSDTAANYSSRRLQGYDSNSVLSATSSSVAPTSNGSFGRIDGATATASTFSNVSLYIPNYTSSNQKSMSIDWVAENNSSTSWTVGMSAILYSGTAAITSLSFSAESASNFVQYSSFSLYGVAKLGVSPVAGPKASGGDIITNDGTYWIHQFLNSGTFTPSQTLSTEYLVVAGGGGGGGNRGGGGGAGGYLTASGFSVTAQSSAITIGAGGSQGAEAVQGGNGGNSVFSTITSTGGGGGGGNSVNGIATGKSGGSGGGGGLYNGTAGAASPSGQGNAGGAGSANDVGAGGGGASATGANAPASGGNGGNGGAGSSSSINGTATTRAGGGGGGGGGSTGAGGTGGAGGGGAGGNGTASTAGSGTTNTGGGGGGGAAGTPGPYEGAPGGSGIVIIRYAI